MALCRINPRRRPLLLGPRPFSSSSSSNPPFPPPPPPASDHGAAHPPPSSPPHPDPGAPRNPASSLFQDIKDRLQSSPKSAPPRRIPMNPPRPSSVGGPSQKLEDVKKMLEAFRGSRTDGGAPSSSGSGATPSFMELLKKNASVGPDAGQKAPSSFDAIRDSLRLGPPAQQRPTRLSTPFISASSNKIFGREMRENDGKAEGTQKQAEKDSAIELTRSYSYEELGKRLGGLRPADAGKGGKEFSLEELQGRIAKLVKIEAEEDRFGGQYSEIRKSIMSIKGKPAKVAGMQMAMLGNIGGQSFDFMRMPPQEELLERYFHPDHMSSEEKMKLELQRVRDEFKMSENDCGSARVQIAQLTVKIKHLSAVLHKKDKHSRKGLQEMVQRRKKYLKYLRRTDWDSYCLVLSKLGLRDVPEYKAPDYKSKSTTKAKSKKSKSKSKRKMKA
ncbi:hypothetical protein ACP70R_027971 [Stipagrostis hirtigluma subsp. patula]